MKMKETFPLSLLMRLMRIKWRKKDFKVLDDFVKKNSKILVSI